MEENIKQAVDSMINNIYMGFFMALLIIFLIPLTLVIIDEIKVLIKKFKEKKAKQKGNS